MTKKQRGKWIVIDGIEGAGKSHQVRFLQQALEREGIKVNLTREPGGTPVAEQLRSVVLSQQDEVIDPVTELLVMWAARRQHLTQRILPALDRGEWVVCDRYEPSTYAYQIVARNLDPITCFDAMRQMVTLPFQPDLTLILDIPPDVSQSRIAARGNLDRMERESMDFFRLVRSGYQDYARNNPSAILVRADGTMDQVHSKICSIIQYYLRMPQLGKKSVETSEPAVGF